MKPWTKLNGLHYSSYATCIGGWLTTSRDDLPLFSTWSMESRLQAHDHMRLAWHSQDLRTVDILVRPNRF